MASVTLNYKENNQYLYLYQYSQIKYYIFQIFIKQENNIQQFSYSNSL